jgi:glycosyltransferase involved in cell wall biosynthesis
VKTTTELIAVDARPLAFPATGNATYLYRMLLQLMTLRPQTEWLFLSHRGLHPTFADVANRSQVEIHIDHGPMAKAGPLWMHWRVPQILREYKPDLFWATLAMLPIGYRSRVSTPAIVNFHDLNSVRAPRTMPAWKRLQHQLLDRRTLSAATRVLCLSQTTRQDIRTAFPETPDERLTVVYPGVELPITEPRAPDGKVGELAPFILCVGTLEPRKNQATLLAAYLSARQSDAARRLPPLVFVGRRGWDEALYRRLHSGELEADNIFYLENASNQELHWCYLRAAFVALPSLHEGFGLPVIEAFQLGKAALLSDIPIFREVGGDSRFVRTTDIADWRDALLEYSAAFPLDERKDDERDARGLARPDFDAEFWSHTKRAAVLSTVMNEVLSGTESRPGEPERKRLVNRSAGGC